MSREGPFFGGRKTTRKRTKHSCYKAWIQNTGFQEKGKGPFQIWFYLGLFLVSEENIFYLNLCQRAHLLPILTFLPSLPSLSILGHAAKHTRPLKGYRACLDEQTDSVKRVLASIQWLSPNTVHITREPLGMWKLYDEIEVTTAGVSSVSLTEEHGAYSLGTRANLILLSSSSSWSMTRATGYIWSKSKLNCTPAGGSRRKFLLSCDEKWKQK